MNLDEDVVRQLSEMARRSHRSLSRVANHMLREGLRAGRKTPTLEPYEPAVFDTGAPLLDVTNVVQALELDPFGGRGWTG